MTQSSLILFVTVVVFGATTHAASSTTSSSGNEQYYCTGYFDVNGNYRKGFHCDRGCCGTSSSSLGKYCCPATTTPTTTQLTTRSWSPSSWTSWSAWSKWNSWNSWSSWNTWNNWNSWNPWSPSSWTSWSQLWSEWSKWSSWSAWNNWNSWNILNRWNSDRWKSWSKWNKWNAWNNWNTWNSWETNRTKMIGGIVGGVSGLIVLVIIAAIICYVKRYWTKDPTRMRNQNRRAITPDCPIPMQTYQPAASTVYTVQCREQAKANFQCYPTPERPPPYPCVSTAWAPENETQTPPTESPSYTPSTTSGVQGTQEAPAVGKETPPGPLPVVESSQNNSPKYTTHH